MHAGAVRVDQEKMSKSLGNFFTIREVLAEHDPEVVRYLLVASHYRSAINYSLDSLHEARKSLTRFYTALEGINLDAQAASDNQAGTAYRERFTAAMDDDFNTPEALAVLFDLARDINRAKQETPDKAQPLAMELKQLANVLGLLQQSPEAFLKGAQQQRLALSEAAIEAKIAQRQAAKADKDFAQADAIRDELAAHGIILKDSREGTTWVVESVH